MGKCACCWLTGVNSLDACSGGRGQANVAHRQSACRGDECLAKVLMGCWSRSMRLCHEPWLVAHWFLPVKRWRKKNLSSFFFLLWLFIYFFYTLLSLQCCRRWFLGRTRRKTAWAWLRGVVLGFREAASSLLSLKVALPILFPPPILLPLLSHPYRLT